MYQIQRPEGKAGTVWKFLWRLRVFCQVLISLCFLLPFSVSGEVIAAGEILTLERAIDIALKNQPRLAGIDSEGHEATIGQARRIIIRSLTRRVYSKISPPQSQQRCRVTSTTVSG
jgi:hypothetical protein